MVKMLLYSHIIVTKSGLATLKCYTIHLFIVSEISYFSWVGSIWSQTAQRWQLLVQRKRSSWRLWGARQASIGKKFAPHKQPAFQKSPDIKSSSGVSLKNMFFLMLPSKMTPFWPRQKHPWKKTGSFTPPLHCAMILKVAAKKRDSRNLIYRQHTGGCNLIQCFAKLRSGSWLFKENHLIENLGASLERNMLRWLLHVFSCNTSRYVLENLSSRIWDAGSRCFQRGASINSSF